ncbi:hypothetical protein B0182_00025 [Moraxella bovis]|nr:hypothetical protein DQF64_01010 [Moraxella bovis]OOR92671.1 hypothetical protein B0182_00025 [Moraxella bovis]
MVGELAVWLIGASDDTDILGNFLYCIYHHAQFIVVPTRTKPHWHAHNTIKSPPMLGVELIWQSFAKWVFKCKFYVA